MDDLFDITNWAWEVQDQSPDKQVYSSKAKAYVPKTNPQYLAFIAQGNVPTIIDTEDNLYDYLIERYEEGLPMNVRLRGVRPRELLDSLTNTQFTTFVTAIGGLTSRNYARFLTSDRIDLSNGSPIRNALDTAGVSVNNIQLAEMILKWSNGD